MVDPQLPEHSAALRSTFTDICSVIGVDRLREEIECLNRDALAPDLWDDPRTAQRVTSVLSHRQSELARLTGVKERLDDLDVLVGLAADEADDEAGLEAELELASLTAIIGELEVHTLLNGEYDERSAVVTIRAGAGGVDAADFAEMLLRMYVRWAERRAFPTHVLDISFAEEAGIEVGDVRGRRSLCVRNPLS